MHDFEVEVLPKLLNATGHIHLPSHHPYYKKGQVEPQYNLTHLKDFGLHLCVGKEWHRFPGSYLIPEGIRVDWIKSEFSGLLPGHFEEKVPQTSRFWLRDGTKRVPSGMNDMNREELDHLVSLFGAATSLNCYSPLLLRPDYADAHDIFRSTYRLATT